MNTYRFQLWQGRIRQALQPAPGATLSPLRAVMGSLVLLSLFVLLLPIALVLLVVQLTLFLLASIGLLFRGSRPHRYTQPGPGPRREKVINPGVGR
ncbi:hypothetical protein [Ferrimonas marina]|uniref:Uncharacterized protein n=1 Tax=Ferrimonas marina TaxID=299255 RepID=A0A1M5XZB0_9GAMM|nr:hypothetical protein [Ferrimonas marina]SHI05155.1 hypothetical protein SAMN02745129_3834 [Ferrimonas marina]